MKKFLPVLFLSSLLVACATVSPTGTVVTPSPQVAFVQACGSLNIAMNTLVQVRASGKFVPTESQKQQVELIYQSVLPMCGPGVPLPADPTAAAQKVTAAVTTLSVMEAVK